MHGFFIYFSLGCSLCLRTWPKCVENLSFGKMKNREAASQDLKHYYVKSFKSKKIENKMHPSL